MDTVKSDVTSGDFINGDVTASNVTGVSSFRGGSAGLLLEGVWGSTLFFLQGTSGESNSSSSGRGVLGRGWEGTTDIIFYTYYYGVLFALSLVNLVGNGLIIYCVLRRKELRVPANYFIVSLACSDLVLGVVYPIYNVSHMEDAAIERSIGQSMPGCLSVCLIQMR